MLGKKTSLNAYRPIPPKVSIVPYSTPKLYVPYSSCTREARATSRPPSAKEAVATAVRIGSTSAYAWLGQIMGSCPSSEMNKTRMTIALGGSFALNIVIKQPMTTAPITWNTA